MTVLSRKPPQLQELASPHVEMLLRIAMRWVVPVLVRPVLSHSLLMLPFEVKLILVTISTTIPTMESDGFWFRHGLRMLTWLVSLLPSSHIPLWAHKSHRFLEVVCL
jgi:hypothetical protein